MKITKKPKPIIVKWTEEKRTNYKSEYQCPCCKSYFQRTLNFDSHITRFKCDCGQELIISKNKILNEEEIKQKTKRSVMPTRDELKQRGVVKLEMLKEIKWHIEELKKPPTQVLDSWIKSIETSIKGR